MIRGRPTASCILTVATRVLFLVACGGGPWSIRDFARLDLGAEPRGLYMGGECSRTHRPQQGNIVHLDGRQDVSGLEPEKSRPNDFITRPFGWFTVEQEDVGGQVT